MCFLRDRFPGRGKQRLVNRFLPALGQGSAFSSLDASSPPQVAGPNRQFVNRNPHLPRVKDLVVGSCQPFSVPSVDLGVLRGKALSFFCSAFSARPPQTLRNSSIFCFINSQFLCASRETESQPLRSVTHLFAPSVSP